MRDTDKGPQAVSPEKQRSCDLERSILNARQLQAPHSNEGRNDGRRESEREREGWIVVMLGLSFIGVLYGGHSHLSLRSRRV